MTAHRILLALLLGFALVFVLVTDAEAYNQNARYQCHLERVIAPDGHIEYVVKPGWSPGMVAAECGGSSMGLVKPVVEKRPVVRRK